MSLPGLHRSSDKLDETHRGARGEDVGTWSMPHNRRTDPVGARPSGMPWLDQPSRPVTPSLYAPASTAIVDPIAVTR